MPSHVAPEGQSAHTYGSAAEFQNLLSPQVHLARPADELHIFYASCPSVVFTLAHVKSQACL